MEIVKKELIESISSQDVSLISPGIYNYVPSSLTSETLVNDFIGLSYNTYKRFSEKYTFIGLNYFNFRSITLSDPDAIPPDIEPDNTTIYTGYDDSLSAIKNLNYILDISFSANYDTYINSLDLITRFRTDGYVKSIYNFYDHFNYFQTGFIDSLTSFKYAYTIHVLSINTQKAFKLTDFSLSALSFRDDVQFTTNNIVKYNYVCKLRYKELFYKFNNLINLIAGVIYENGLVILSVPIMCSGYNNTDPFQNLIGAEPPAFLCLDTSGDINLSSTFSESIMGGLNGINVDNYISNTAFSTWFTGVPPTSRYNTVNKNKSYDSFVYLPNSGVAYNSPQFYSKTHNVVVSLTAGGIENQYQRISAAEVNDAGGSATSWIVGTNEGSLYSVSSQAANTVLRKTPLYGEVKIYQMVNAGRFLFAAAKGADTSGAYDSYNLGCILKSEDNGLTWNISNNKLSTSAGNSSIGSAINGNVVTGIVGKGMYYSTNYGETWTLSTGLTAGTPEFIELNKVTGSLYCMSGAAIYTSSNSGVNWSSVTTLTASQVNLKIDNNGILYTLQANNKIYKATNSSATAFAYVAGTSLTSSTGKNLCFDSLNNIYVATNNGVWKSTDGGTNFTIKNTGFASSTNLSYVLCSSKDNLYAIFTSNKFTYKSIDGGSNWTQIDTIDFDFINYTWVSRNDDLFIHGHSLTPGDSGIRYMYILYHGSNSFKNILTNRQGASGATNNSFLVGELSDVYIYNNGGTDEFLASSRTSGIFRKAGGYFDANYFDLSNDTTLTGNARDVRNIDGIGSTVYIATKAGVYKSTNGGVNWTQQNTGLTDTDIYYVACLTGSTTGVMCATRRNGIFKSTDSGATWAYAGLSGYGVNSIFMASTANILIATTYQNNYFDDGYPPGGGLFQSTDYGSTYARLNMSGHNGYDFNFVFFQSGSANIGGWTERFDINNINLAIKQFDIVFSNNKNIVRMTVKIPKENYNVSSKMIDSDGTKLKENAFISKINIYNEKNDLVAQAKLNKPIKKSKDFDQYVSFNIDVS